MGAKITFQNQKIYKGEEIADIKVEGGKKLKPLIVLQDLIAEQLMNF